MPLFIWVEFAKHYYLDPLTNSKSVGPPLQINQIRIDGLYLFWATTPELSAD